MAKPDNSQNIRLRKMNDFSLVCIASLTTSLHITFPLLKCLNHMGSINFLTEDKSYLAFDDTSTGEYDLGNIHVRVIDCVSILSEEELAISDYQFTVFDVKEFLPGIQVDKYIILPSRKFFRDQLTNPEFRNTPIYSVFNNKYHNTKEYKEAKIDSFVNEQLVRLNSFSMYDKMIYNLITKKQYNYSIPGELVGFITKILEGFHQVTSAQISAYVREVSFN